MVTVRVSETYDLSTEVNKIGLIGIHTPGIKGIVQMWSGLMRNYRYMRLVGCDVTMACASMLPADPLQIGTEAGDVAPQDMFNPILFRAVSNDSFNTLVSRIYNPDLSALTPSLNKGSTTGGTGLDDFAIYYGLLADPDGWRKAMPQSGLSMKGLYPIVYQVINTYGNEITPVDLGALSKGGPFLNENNAGTIQTPTAMVANSFRGPALRMPRIPTMAPTLGTGYSPEAAGPDEMVFNGAGTTDIVSTSDEMTAFNTFPTTYVGMIVMPPAKLNKLYYRMKVTWTIEFEEVRPLQEVQVLGGLSRLGNVLYTTDYAAQSKAMDSITNMVDTAGATIEKVMDSSR